MLKKKSDWNKNKHRKIYIALTLIIFTLVGCAHLLILGSGMTMRVGFIVLPQSINLYAIVMAFLMVVMAGFYLLDAE